MDSRNSINKMSSSFLESHSKDENSRPENPRNNTKKNFHLKCHRDRPSFKTGENVHYEGKKIPRNEQPVVQSIPQILTDNSRHAYPMLSSFSTMNTSLAVDMPTVNHHNGILNQNQPIVPLPGGLESCNGSTFNPYSTMGNPANKLYGTIPTKNYFPSPVQDHMRAKENLFFPALKQIYHLTNSVLYPPDPNAPLPTVKERPLGCKTVYVEGWPEKITEKIVREIFDLCGTVQSIKMSKNFCYITFSNELFVENALYFSGYWIKIENKDDPPFTGRLRVEFAQSSDDLYDHDHKQRAVQQNVCHQELDNYRLSASSVVCYSEHEASIVSEKLKNSDTFIEAANVLIKWLEKGECVKRNASSFFSLIQITQNQVGKLQLDKVEYEGQLNKAKITLKKQLEGIIRHLIEVEKIYKAASLQKCWDQFTKAQRKNIEAWKKQANEWKDAHLKEIINEREDEEMELSDEEHDNKTKSCDVEELKKQQDEHTSKLKATIDSLKLQIKATQNEKMVSVSDHHKELKDKDNEISSIQESLQNSEKQVLNFCEKFSQQESEIKKLHSFKNQMTEKNPHINNKSSLENNVSLKTSNSNKYLSENARLLGLISAFLHVHPFGANINYICSYINQIDSTIQSEDIENLLKSHPMMFKEDSTGIGASLVKKWHFIGFETQEIPQVFN